MLRAQVGSNGAPAIHRDSIKKEGGEIIGLVAGRREKAKQLFGAGLISGIGGRLRGEGDA